MQSEAKNNLFFRSEIIRSKLNESDRIIFFGIVSDKENASLYSDNVKKLMNFESVDPVIIQFRLNRLDELSILTSMGLHKSQCVRSIYKPFHQSQEQPTHLKNKIYAVLTNCKQWLAQKFINPYNHCQEFMLNQLEMMKYHIHKHTEWEMYEEEIEKEIEELITNESNQKSDSFLIEIVLAYIPPNRDNINGIHQECIPVVYGFYSVGAQTMLRKIPISTFSSCSFIDSGIIGNPELIDYIKVESSESSDPGYPFVSKAYIMGERKKLIMHEH